MPDFKYNGKIYYNPVQLVMEQIGGYLKAPILWRPKEKQCDTGELKDIPHIRQKMLTTQLQRIRRRRFISREKYLP